MKRAVTAAVTGGAMLLLAGTATAASLGPNTAEVKAFHFRAFQTEMMVAALKCRQVNEGDVSALYNNFVMRHRGLMAENARVLKAYFKRTYGRRDAGRMDALVTRLANQASERAHDQKNYCRATYDRLREALTLDSRRLEGIVADRSPLDAMTELAEAR